MCRTFYLFGGWAEDLISLFIRDVCDVCENTSRGWACICWLFSSLRGKLSTGKWGSWSNAANFMPSKHTHTHTRKVEPGCDQSNE
jgi:hypothetical protein